MGIPTRVVGIPNWSNKRGNHTWLEIWDGDWHFTGACEADPKGLDRGWFIGDAAQAQKDVPEHAIYAVSFAKRLKETVAIDKLTGQSKGESADTNDYLTFDLAPEREYKLTVGTTDQTIRTKAAGSQQLIDVKLK